MTRPVCYNEFLKYESEKGITLLDWQKQYAQEYFQDRAGYPMRRWMTARGMGRTIIMNEMARFVAENAQESVAFIESVGEFNKMVMIREDGDRVSVSVDASKLLGAHK